MHKIHFGEKLDFLQTDREKLTHAVQLNRIYTPLLVFVLAVAGIAFYHLFPDF